MTKRLPLALIATLLLAAPLRAADDSAPGRGESFHLPQKPTGIYPLSKIIPTYTRPDKDLPPLDDLLKSTISLAIVNNVLTAPTDDHKGQPIALEKLGAAPASAIDTSAIELLYTHITRFYNDRHIASVYTAVNTHDISEEERDLRGANDTLTLLISASHVVELHTARRVPNAPDKTDDPADAAILKNSPIQPDSKTATDLVNKSALSAYIATLAKSGLTVTPQLSQPEKPGELALTYVIARSAPPAP